MSTSTIAILSVLVWIAAAMLLWPPFKKPRVHMIDTLDLMRLQDARRTRRTGRRTWAGWVIMAVVLVSLLWSLLGS